MTYKSYIDIGTLDWRRLVAGRPCKKMHSRRLCFWCVGGAKLDPRQNTTTSLLRRDLVHAKRPRRKRPERQRVPVRRREGEVQDPDGKVGPFLFLVLLRKRGASVVGMLVFCTADHNNTTRQQTQPADQKTNNNPKNRTSKTCGRPARGARGCHHTTAPPQTASRARRSRRPPNLIAPPTCHSSSGRAPSSGRARRRGRGRTTRIAKTRPRARRCRRTRRRAGRRGRPTSSGPFFI
jgi:hypothetical protein